jgi:5-methylcytosine-specific restriction endonuclease McrA
MPIKPENRARYPADWKQIRTAILARAENRCERCRVPNRARITRGADEDAGTYMTDDANVYSDVDGTHLGQRRMSDYMVKRMTNIVLTVAHLDHTPENCAPDNLQALCQQCHLRLDAQQHAESARATRQANRRARSNNMELFA